MQVICIDDNWGERDFYSPDTSPAFNEKCEVNDIATTDDGTYYGLVEHPDGFYLSNNFAPCSDIDETEMIRDYKMQTA